MILRQQWQYWWFRRATCPRHWGWSLLEGDCRRPSGWPTDWAPIRPTGSHSLSISEAALSPDPIEYATGQWGRPPAHSGRTNNCLLLSGRPMMQPQTNSPSLGHLPHSRCKVDPTKSKITWRHDFVRQKLISQGHFFKFFREHVCTVFWKNI